MATSPTPAQDAQDQPVDDKPPAAEAPAVQESPMQASTTGPVGQPVDNPLVDVVPPDEPSQELRDSDLPPEISPGAMGVPRIQLVMALGFQADHPFDAEVEDRLRQVCPDYAGTVTSDMWRKVLTEGHTFRDTSPSAP